MSAADPFDLVAAALECPASTLTAASGLGRHPRWDSLGHVSVMMALEAHYGVALDDESVRRFERMDAIVELHRDHGRRAGGFDRRWETEVYARGRMLNRYPSEIVVSFIMRAYPTPESRIGKRVLDLGCGAGNNVRFLAREGCEVLGVDGSEHAIGTARERLAADGLTADLEVVDFAALQLPDAAFDCVIDRGSITHNRRSAIEAILDKVHRALRPGGLLLSEMFSARTGREHGHALGDGSYDSFRAGYFADVPLVFFATREDLDRLFGSRFACRSIEHNITEDAEGRVTMASWKSVWQR